MDKRPLQLVFITVNYNGINDTREFLQSILSAQLTIDFAVVVVDNGSIVNEWELLKEEFPFIQGIRSEQNLGFAGGNNLGLRVVEADFYYFINNDTLLPAKASKEIGHMIDFLNSNSLIGGISPKIKYVDNPDLVQFAGCTPLSRITLRNRQIGYQEIDNGQFEEIKPIPYMHGAAMLVKAKVMEDVGSLPELYFLYYEELDWCHSIREKYELYYYPFATILHKESASTGIDSPFKTFYLSRNRLIYAFRNREGMTRFLAVSYLIIISCFRTFLLLGRGSLDNAKATFKGMKAGVQWMLAT